MPPPRAAPEARAQHRATPGSPAGWGLDPGLPAGWGLDPGLPRPRAPGPAAPPSSPAWWNWTPGSPDVKEGAAGRGAFAGLAAAPHRRTGPPQSQPPPPEFEAGAGRRAPVPSAAGGPRIPPSRRLGLGPVLRSLPPSSSTRAPSQTLTSQGPAGPRHCHAHTLGCCPPPGRLPPGCGVPEPTQGRPELTSWHTPAIWHSRRPRQKNQGRSASPSHSVAVRAVQLEPNSKGAVGGALAGQASTLRQSQCSRGRDISL